MPRLPTHHPHFFRQWREFRGLTLEEVAFLADLSKGTISKIETYEQNYTPHSLHAIARALRTNPENLISRPPTEADRVPPYGPRAEKRRSAKDVDRELESLLKKATLADKLEAIDALKKKKK